MVLEKVALILTRVLDFPTSDSCVFLFVLFCFVLRGWLLYLVIHNFSQLCMHTVIFADKVHLIKAMVFSVLMHGWDSWAIKKAEHSRVDVFELWCWRIFLRVPWTTRRSNQSILEEISPGCSLEGLMLKLKLQYLPT